MKIGRNDPCPCGNGKKYKHCCIHDEKNAVSNLATPKRKPHHGAVNRVMDWLMNKHPKAVLDTIDSHIFAELDEEDQLIIKGLDAETWGVIYQNTVEWLLAEGAFLHQGNRKRYSDIVLAAGGPLLTLEQRQWIEQLPKRTLRLYDVTDVIPGQQMTLCESLDMEAAPIVVQEISGSIMSIMGTKIAARIMEVDGHFELSGAVYAFTRIAGENLLSSLIDAIDNFDMEPEFLMDYLGVIIRRKWLEQFYLPTPIPDLRDAYSGDPMLFITDHYRVNDWDALAQSIATQSDMDGDRAAGWNRIIECEDGQLRSRMTINIESQPDRISVFYKTQHYADDGRPWLESLAHDAIQFITREITDPKGAMANLPDTDDHSNAFAYPSDNT